MRLSWGYPKGMRATETTPEPGGTVPTLRDAGEGDLPAIVAITNDVIATTTAIWSSSPTTITARAAWFHQRRSQGYPVLVVEEAGVVVGYGSFGAFRVGDGYGRTVEHSIHIDAAWRGRGLGTTVLLALIDQAVRSGMHAMVAGIGTENEASVALHRRAGFVEVGRLPEVGRKFDRWLDLLLMQKLLVP